MVPNGQTVRRQAYGETMSPGGSGKDGGQLGDERGPPGALPEADWPATAAGRRNRHVCDEPDPHWTVTRVGFQNLAAGPDRGFYAARSYSLMRPPRTGRHLIRFRERSATG